MVLAIAGGWFTRPQSKDYAAYHELIPNLDNGAYLLNVAGCAGCHTAENSDLDLAGGVILSTKFGNFITPNITSDVDHGIGKWDIVQFANAMKQGISPTSQHYFPALPYQYYQFMSDQDMVDLYGALMASTAHPVPSKPNEVIFPFSVRMLQGGWKTLFFEHVQPASSTPPTTLNQAEIDQWQRGRYLVNAVSHCGACHTPRGILGGEKTDLYLAGGIGMDGKKVPSINESSLNQQGWTADDIAFALKTGILMDGDAFGGSMAEFVDHSTSKLTESDATSIGFYLLNQSGF